MKQEKDAPLLRPADVVEIEAIIDRVIFHNASNGYAVVRVLPQKNGRNAPDALVCVGTLFAPNPGTRLRIRGKYVNNPRYGRQFAFDYADEIMPTSRDDICHYLASGLIKGVGTGLASRIVALFGDDTIRILDEEPQRLLEVHGVGPKNLDAISKSWEEHRGMRGLHLFLQPHGISAAYAVRIYKAYGDTAREVIKSNPYRLAMDIRGIGFLTADGIAAKMGFAGDHPLRVQAATLYALQKATDDGHVFMPEEELVKNVCKQLDVTPDLVLDAIAALTQEQRLTREELLAPGGEPLTGIYLSRFHHCEARTSFYLKRLLLSPKAVLFKDEKDILQRLPERLPVILAPAQMAAVETAMRAKALVITGGPGTGKTTIINAIIKVYETAKAKILLAAPTGRAAKRMSEATGREASTIHRLLEYSPRDDRFARNEDNPLACGLLVVDEASMMDCLLFYHLLKAVPLGATFIMVGDVHQLPSVGPGNVLADIIDSGTVPVAELNEIFRQSAESEIICNAHLINRGKMPIMEYTENRVSDFYFISRDEPESAAELMVDLIKNHIPRRFGLDPINEIQLLTPMHKGAAGSENMNRMLQNALNPNGLEVRRGERSFRLHDKVMQVRNNYDKDIFNGDIGRIVHISPREKTLSVNFDGTVMPYEFEELDELVPAYAISIHKAQGSEYPAVVIPLMMQHYVLLQRNLIYTGVTRGKKLVVLVGEKKALQIAIRNSRTGQRNTWLASRLAKDWG